MVRRILRTTPAAAAVARVAVLSVVTVAGVATVAGAVTGPAATSGAGNSAAVTAPAPAPTVHSPLVGAYYSDWFPSNAAQGTLRQHLVPSQGPDPSRVDSADPAVAQEAIAQATRSGVDFFALDWWPTRPAQNVNVNAFLRAKNIGDIKFCMLYETWDLGFDAGNESTPVTPQLEARFDADLVTFAHRYFANPSYLRIRGRPVVVLYLTRTLTGDVQGMMTGARAVLEAQGYDPFFIGDEVFWRVTAENTAAGAPGFTEAPQVSRIDLFDAVTAYSLYAGGPPDPLTPAPDFTTFPGLTSLVADQLALYRRYQQASHGWVPVVPDVTPGFNSRGVRLSVNEHAEPRQWVPGASPGSTLAHYLSQIARPLLSPTLPMVFVTSWNEWNEDTAVAPVGGTPTASDDSPSGTAYTQGYTYGGEGWSDLDAIRDFSDMAWGRVTFAGRARAHVTVTAAVGSRIVETVHTDAEGFYVLPRTATCPPTLVLSAGGRRVTLRCRATVATRADLTDADAVEPGTRADPWQARRT